MALASGQWLRTQAATTFTMNGLPLGVAGQITISGTSRSWANASATCAETAFGDPEFSSVALRSAWIASGLSTRPLTSQPAGFCEEDTPGGGALEGNPNDGSGRAKVLAEGLGVIDVSALPRQPRTLAKELTSGETRSRLLNQSVVQRDSTDPGFERALILLETPLLGASGRFHDLLKALPMLKGVVVLGRVRTAAGLSGVGFAAGRDPHQASVILNPHTGHVEELRNVPAGTLFFSVGAESFWNPGAPHPADSSPLSLTMIVLHSDPRGNQTVVNTVPRFAYPS